jgi:hypothetical protein
MVLNDIDVYPIHTSLNFTFALSIRRLSFFKNTKRIIYCLDSLTCCYYQRLLFFVAVNKVLKLMSLVELLLFKMHRVLAFKRYGDFKVIVNFWSSKKL